VRLEQFEGQVAPMYIKKIYQSVEFVALGETGGYWFKAPHELVVVDKHGIERTDQARAAGPTLVWEYDGLTLRLEGIPDSASAARIALSATRR
jgi:hypothetical protein